MAKKIYDPITALLPLPAVMVSCQEPEQKPNIITISWTGIVCSEPPMLSISVRKSRYSYGIIKRTGEFVVNITSHKLIRATDICGNVSGRNHDKFQLAGLTPEPASKVRVPLIKECPINLECQTRSMIELGSHDIFIAEIVATHIDEEIMDKDGRFDIKKLDPIAYCTKAREYWSSFARFDGRYGFTLETLKSEKAN